MAQHEETSMDKELQTRIETYIVLHAETLHIPLGMMEWSEALAPTSDTDIQPPSPVYKLQVPINGALHFLTFTAEECHAVERPEDPGAEAWPRMAEKIDDFLGAFAPKKPRIGY
jgi:hypothetical protein